jgi:hypothetical protein
MIDKNHRLLLMCMMALATGRTSFDAFKKEQGYDKDSILSVYMAICLIDIFLKMNDDKCYKLGYPKLERVFDSENLARLENKDSEDVVINDDRELEEEWISNGQFAKKETVAELLEYLIRLSEMQMVEWQAYLSNADKEAPISDDFLFFGGDGDPIKTCAGTIEKTMTGRYSFHGFMEIVKKTNQLNEDLISFLIAPFYARGDSKKATDNNIRYFVDFNDPTTSEREIEIMIFATNLKALMEMKRSGCVDANPSNLDDYMIQRATSSPKNMALLLPRVRLKRVQQHNSLSSSRILRPTQHQVPTFRDHCPTRRGRSWRRS